MRALIRPFISTSPSNAAKSTKIIKMAALTNHLLFDHEITNVVRINSNALAICQGNDLTLCSPFIANRGLSGMHNLFYQHPYPIIGVCDFLHNSSLVYKIINEAPPKSTLCSQIFVALLDSANFVTIIDLARKVVITTLCLDTSDEILNFCTSKKVGELVVLTTQELIIYEICPMNKSTQFKAIRKQNVNVTPNKNGGLEPYGNGFLISCDGGLKYYTNGTLEDFYTDVRKGKAYDFRVDSKNIILAQKKNKAGIFSIVGGKKVGINSFSDYLWDTACNFIISMYHDNELVFVNSIDTSIRKVVKLSQPIQRAQYLYAALNSLRDKIVVSIFTEQSAHIFAIALSVLENVKVDVKFEEK